MANYSSVPQNTPYPSGGNAPVPDVGYAPGYPQDQAPGYPQGQAPGYPQGQAPGYPQGQATGYSQGQAPGYPQGQTPGYPQEKAPGYPPPAAGYPAGSASNVPGGGDTKYSEEPSAPPPEFDQIPGYGNIGLEGSALPPPSYEEALREPPQRDTIPSSTFITEEDAKEALANFVSENCCYGKGPLKEICLNDFKSSSAFHYSLSSFCESRTTKRKSEPYRGQGINVVGAAPGPWDIQAQPPEMFKKSELKMEVPNTACVKPCHSCHARGFFTCTRCFGRGQNTCSFCNGSGRRDALGGQPSSSCISCNGTGHTRCTFCGGSCQTRCGKCQGHANLKWYIQLHIEWKNHVDHHVVERTSLPSELVKHVSGQKAFEETYPRVWPVNHFPEQEINSASQSLVQQHSSKFPLERMLMQNHKVRIVPVTEVFYNHKDKISSFFVYGLERKVHFPDYPAKCCCGCTVL